MQSNNERRNRERIKETPHEGGALELGKIQHKDLGKTYSKVCLVQADRYVNCNVLCALRNFLPFHGPPYGGTNRWLLSSHRPQPRRSCAALRGQERPIQRVRRCCAAAWKRGRSSSVSGGCINQGKRTGSNGPLVMYRVCFAGNDEIYVLKTACRTPRLYCQH